MKKNTRKVGKTKAATKITKRTVGTKGSNLGVLKIPASMQKKLAVKAEADGAFKGNNPIRYANFILKNFVSTTK